ncbi:MAG TPA: hypothetical protein ENJ31_03475, partial [Anaerolineae bacterium]|nr:hypothetical protein [Anaerolineae bacterium]
MAWRISGAIWAFEAGRSAVPSTGVGEGAAVGGGAGVSTGIGVAVGAGPQATNPRSAIRINPLRAIIHCFPAIVFTSILIYHYGHVLDDGGGTVVPDTAA